MLEQKLFTADSSKILAIIICISDASKPQMNCISNEQVDF